ncbi:ABC transporter ATP-binding protein [Vallitalea guaymasensis]|uniref:ABC transporter ATP-binding protein n=1 Tax=Vallitalea guaymasensis TaxID=1185412 RepID=A0A8J8MCI0_9FIRM|nr:ABC transporter ATP-binding protein [Vallitalea guaymasensis]QUH30372.1 ABC transporter ATP-binding protein [Vallitalea guaymasensis]
MLSVVKRIIKLANEFAYKIKIAFVLSIFEGICAQMPMMLVLYVFYLILEEKATMKQAWIVGIVMFSSVIIRTILKRLIDGFQSGTGYEIFERERLLFADRIKRIPMGYFTSGNVGKITSIVTTNMSFAEEFGISSMSKVVTGYISMILSIIFMLIIDVRIGIVNLIILVGANITLKNIQKVGVHHAKIRTKAQARLIDAVLEYIEGIPVVKSFNLSGKRAKKIQKEYKDSRDTSIEFEKKFMKPLFWFELVFVVGTGATILLITYLFMKGNLDGYFMLTMLIYIFQMYIPFKVLGGLTGVVRIMDAGLDSYEELKNLPLIDEDGKDIYIDSYDIEFKNVTFAYEERDILKNISFKVPEHSMTALVGKSGCGKSTITNLIARFWDTDKGKVLVGGVDVKTMTSDSLLKNISIVFQNVYLFKDTIMNNIKFGKPEATKEEVIEAAKKARCHDFIMALDKGYDTMVGEAGASLSGGEKQRISIARAILKDAPIILLDEATASVDPDNERYIQEAISALVKDKTLIVIAHRLATIKEADQILVIDEGKIIQKGTHEELARVKGRYQEFWKIRERARSWEIGKK